MLRNIAVIPNTIFIRMFKEDTDEALYQFMKRVRLERSAWRLKVEKDKSIKDKSISEIGVAELRIVTKNAIPRRDFSGGGWSIKRKRRKTEVCG